MKKIGAFLLILVVLIFLFAPFVKAQNYIGKSKHELLEDLKKREIKVKYSPDSIPQKFIYFESAEVAMKWNLEKDTVVTFNKILDCKHLDAVKEEFRSLKYEHIDEYLWKHDEASGLFQIYIQKQGPVFIITTSKIQ